MSVNEALALIRRRRFEEALPLLATAVRAHPDDPYAAYYLAYAFLGAKDPQPALAILSKLLEAHPDFTDARNLLGLARIRNSDFAGATAEYQEVLKGNPQNPAALLGLGMIHVWKREGALAEEYLDRALRRDSGARDALVFKADLRFEQGDVAGAVNLLDEARRVKAPSLPEVSDLEISDRLMRYEATLSVRRRRSGLPPLPGWVQATIAGTLLITVLAGAGFPGSWNGMAHYQKGKQRLGSYDYSGCAAEMAQTITAVPTSPKAWAYEAYCDLLDHDNSAGLSAWYTARTFEPGISLDSAADQQTLLTRVAQAIKLKGAPR